MIYAQYSLRDVSWQIAGILVANPLFVYVTRTLTREAANRPELFDSDVRKWLTNLALVVAAVIVTGDLIAFLARLLSGDLTLTLTSPCRVRSRRRRVRVLSWIAA